MSDSLIDGVDLQIPKQPVKPLQLRHRVQPDCAAQPGTSEIGRPNASRSCLRIAVEMARIVSRAPVICVARTAAPSQLYDVAASTRPGCRSTTDRPVSRHRIPHQNAFTAHDPLPRSARSCSQPGETLAMKIAGAIMLQQTQQSRCTSLNVRQPSPCGARRADVPS